MERKATKPGMSRLNSDSSKSLVIPIEGKIYTFRHFKHSHNNQCKLDDLMFLTVLTEFPAPKNELFQRFHVYYLGCESVAKPVGKKKKKNWISF